MILKQNGIWGEIMYENVEYDQHFIGEFNVEGDSFNGELIFNKKNGGILIHLTKDVTIESAFRYHYGKVAVIIGKLNAGIVVTLFNNRCVKNHTNNFKLLTLNFVSDYFVWSDKERRDTLYNKMVSIIFAATTPSLADVMTCRIFLCVTSPTAYIPLTDVFLSSST